MQLDISSFFNKITSTYSEQKPFVAYRKPNEELVNLLVQQTNELVTLTNFKEEGFVFMPFHTTGKKVIFPKAKCDSFKTTISQAHTFKLLTVSELIEKSEQFEISKEKHLQLISKTVDFIAENKAQKIVVSRKEVIRFTQFNMLNSFKKMLQNYKNAFVYVWFHPEIGLWMGATPERLINIKGSNFTTMALAGTQPFEGATDVIWQEKEQQEQQYVTDFILENIKEEVTISEVKGPYTIKAGSLLHLRTDIMGQLKEVNLLENLIKYLHPTPAVCGLPKETAKDFILQNENYTRSYYSGYLGELNVNENTQLFVNLRCMEVKDAKIALYIGGGITKGSIPEKEFEETVAKAMVMKKVL